MCTLEHELTFVGTVSSLPRAIEAFCLLSELEGCIPALETAHAIAGAIDDAANQLTSLAAAVADQHH